MPLLKPVAVLLKRWMKHKPPASVICCIEHCPGAFHGFGRYVPIYGMEVPPSAQWQQHAFANGDPPWVMHHVPRVAKGDIETYRHSYTSPGFGGYPQINFVGECLFVVSTSSLKSIVQAFTAVHGPCGCAGFAVMNGSVDSTSWAGEPFAIVDCRGCDVTQLIKQLKTPRLIRGCIAIIFHVEVRTQEPISRDEFHSFYASSQRLQWRSSILRN
jgi:hypothetical protein